jgi:hypothetical protein
MMRKKAMNDIRVGEAAASSDDEVEGMKIAVALGDDLASWQKLNVAAFTISGVASQTVL